MAAPTVRAAMPAVLSDSGTISSPSSTAVGDLLVFVVWSQGTVIPSHAIRANYFEWGSIGYNDGTTDGRLSVAVIEATSGGINSYQPYTVSDATAGQTNVGGLVITTGTWNRLRTTVIPPFATTNTTNNQAPNPPSVTGLTGDYQVICGAGWHVTTAGSTTTTQPTNYLEQVDGPGGSHVTHLAISTRALTALSNATEDPGGYTDNVTPNGTGSFTAALDFRDNQGTGSGSLGLTGSAEGTVANSGIDGVASGTLGFTGAATGTVDIFATASGTLGLTGASTGQVLVQGVGAGALGFTLVSSGLLEKLITASGTLGFTGASTGSVELRGVGLGALGFVGGSEGQVLVQGTSTGTIIFTLVSDNAPKLATAAGSIGFTLTADAATTPVPVPNPGREGFLRFIKGMYPC